jgi:hypothetical protein
MNMEGRPKLSNKQVYAPPPPLQSPRQNKPGRRLAGGGQMHVTAPGKEEGREHLLQHRKRFGK